MKEGDPRSVKFLDPLNYAWEYSPKKYGHFAYYVLNNLGARIPNSGLPMVVFRKGEDIIRVHSYKYTVTDYPEDSADISHILDMVELEILFSLQPE